MQCSLVSKVSNFEVVSSVL